MNEETSKKIENIYINLNILSSALNQSIDKITAQRIEEYKRSKSENTELQPPVELNKKIINNNHNKVKKEKC